MKFTAEVVVRIMESDLFHTIGVPKIIVFDNGSQFRSHVFNQFLNRCGVQHIFTTVHPTQYNASQPKELGLIAKHYTLFVAILIPQNRRTYYLVIE